MNKKTTIFQTHFFYPIDVFSLSKKHSESVQLIRMCKRTFQSYCQIYVRVFLIVCLSNWQENVHLISVSFL